MNLFLQLWPRLRQFVSTLADILIAIGNITIAALSITVLIFVATAMKCISIFIDVCIHIGEVMRLSGQSLIQLIARILTVGKNVSRIKIRIPRRSPSTKPHKKPSKLFLKVRYVLLGAMAATLFFGIIQMYNLVISLPNPTLIGEVNYPVSTQIFDRNGVLLYEIYKDQNRTPVTLSQVPDYLLQATVAIEDKDFYNHNGVSLIGGIARAIRDSVKTGSLQGGSTITQQLVKTSLLSPERTLPRKIREAIIALWAERIYTKQEILEMYLNQVSYGGSAYGVEQASQTYFGKSVGDLSIGQAALLAGLPKAPTTYSPFTNIDYAKKRRDEVLLRMYELSYITRDTLDAETQKPLVVKKHEAPIKTPHFVFFVKALLEKEYGVRQVEEGGLRVYTSIDSRLQSKVEDIVNEQLLSLKNYNIGNAGVLVTIPSTGEIVAMVGSKNYFDEPYGAYNVTTAVRQPGSTIKPLLYSLALSKGYTLATILQDSPVVYSTKGSKPYAPVNYDGIFHGPTPLRYALGNSYNVPAVKTLHELGIKQFIDHAKSMGITTWNNPQNYGLSITLGGAGTTLYDLSTAFGVFANGGMRVDLSPITMVEDYKGAVLFRSNPVKKQVLDPKVSFLINSTLSDNQARKTEFGSNSMLVIPNHVVAVKTGTSNDKRDNLTIGYTNTFLTAVWVGNNDNSPMNPTLTSGITGAAPIWHSVMSYILDSYALLVSIDSASPSFDVPSGVIHKKCSFGRDEYFIEGTEKNISCALPTPTRMPDTSVNN